MTWSYSASNLNATPVTPAVVKDQVRFLVGDTDDGDHQLEDEEITFTVGLRASIYGSAAVCCRMLATKFARKADSAQGPIHLAYSQISRNYAAMANRYENQANSFGALPGYAGGISVTDKVNREQDDDRVTPEFAKGMTDNFIPVAPAGNEVEDHSDTSQNL